VLRAPGSKAVENCLGGLLGAGRLAQDPNSFGNGNEFRQGLNCIFSITPWRWALIVRSVQPNDRAACLLVWPLTTSSKTSRSRGVKLAIRERTTSRVIFERYVEL